MSAMNCLWSGHCREIPLVHFFGTEDEVDDWITSRHSSTVVRKLDEIGMPYTWIKSAPGVFSHFEHGSEPQVSGYEAYIQDEGDPLVSYGDPSLRASGDPIDWLIADRVMLL